MIPSGTLFAGRYRVASVLGEGAHSVVYAADDESGQKRTVALKVIHRHLTGDPQVRQRFEREAKTLARLEGEHVVRMFDFIEDDGLLAIALERVDGPSLATMLAKEAPLPLNVAIEVSLQVCAALGAAHANGVVHRDLKTANVLVQRDTTSGPQANVARSIRVKVVDFGLCRLLRGDENAGLTEQGMVLGTADYMAPEQARGDEVDARADLYAAGVMLYEMTVGAPPFSGRTAVGTMTAHLSEAPRSPRAARPDASITPALEAVILRALAKSPEDRFASARELANAIAAARDETKVIAPTSGPHDQELGTSDTDLRLSAPSFTNARTLRTDELAAQRVDGLDEAPPVRINVTPNEPGPLVAPARAKDAKDAKDVKARSYEISDEATVVSGEALPSRWKGIWLIVAVVAAAVGVAIGVIIGTR